MPYGKALWAGSSARWRGSAAVPSRTAHGCEGVELVQEDDRGGTLTCSGKEPPHRALALAEKAREQVGPIKSRHEIPAHQSL